MKIRVANRMISTRSLALCIAAATSAISAAAGAQTAPPAAPESSPALTPTSAAPAAPVVSPAASAPPASAPSATAAEVRQRAAQGEAFFAAGNFDGAIAEFLRVYELLPADSERYVLWYNIAQAQERMFRFAEAIGSYRRYLDEAGTRATDRADIEATLRTLERLLGTVVIRTNVEHGEVWVDSHRVGPLGAPVRLPGGRHVVQVRAADHEFAQAEIEVASGQTVTTVRLTLPLLYRGIRPRWFWTGLVATAGSLVTFAAFGTAFLVTSAENHRLLVEAGPGQDGLTNEETQRVRVLDGLATGFLAGVAVLAVGTGALYAVTNWRVPRPPATMPTAMMVPGGAMIGLTGQF